jgi:sucrose 6(F)-phosphate phosphorylase
MGVSNRVQLITYPDSLGGDLPNLQRTLEKHFPDLFTGGVHILPPFPSSGDRGFAPLTYLEIEPKFGTWEDIIRISNKHTILLDLMINHISAKSAYFQDFLANGRESTYANLFIPLDKIWPDGEPVPGDIIKMFLRRPEPFSEFQIKKTGKTERVWTTFGKTNPSEQIDLDINSPETRKLISTFFETFSKNGVKIVRLDAVGYVIKKLGTSCFFVEPEIFDFLEWVSKVAKSYDIDLLPEIHGDYKTQFKLAEKGYWIYDFILPYSILDSFVNKTSQRLKDYLKVRPHNQFTMLDCHDGIPIKPDLNGLYKSEDAQHVVDVCLQRGANLSLIVSAEHKDPNGFDVHQIRGTIYSLLGENDDIYLAARAIQLFSPGIPQIYYVGLLAGKNDTKMYAQTGDGREINRHNYSFEEIANEVQKPVVRKLIRLIQFRNNHPAFNGKFAVNQSSNRELSLTWTHDNDYANLLIDFTCGTSKISFSDRTSGKEVILE